jgi:membrane-associated phospholipid phosphatase
MTTYRRLACWSTVFAVAMASGAGRPHVVAATIDANAGTWQMIVLSSPAQISVAAPAAATSADYAAEVTSIRSAQSRLTKEQRTSIEYWSHGGILRWNEIMLGLVSRANLPPAPTADDTYPVPDANNPFADPQFPFANPPYAARAYSYVAVAQYEALKVAWYYKFLYNRPGPADLDRGIESLMPATGVPSYPSEDAVVSSVTAEMLKLLFPTMVEEITLKAGQQRQAAVLSGRATASDVAAGVAIGQAVAALVTARAATDGMRTAGGSPALWRAMADAAVTRGETPWISRDLPARPPMLPLFSGVRAWMMTPEDIVRERPGPPPSTSSPLMAREVAEVKRAVTRLSREELAIAYKWADGPSTPTPPGHWNFIAAPYIKQAQLSEVRAARAFALLNMTMHDAAVGCWDVKYFYFNPRPTQLDPTIKTAIGLPNFPSYTSGHSTFSAAAAELLSYLFPSNTAFFHAQKDEASISRLYGGIHYRADIEVGNEHGQRIGAYTVRFARTDGADR